MVAAGANNWFTTNGHPLLQNHTSQPHQSPAPPPPSCPASQEFPHSWSQLVLGFAGEDDKTMEQPKTYIGNLEFRPPKSSEILMKCKSGAAKKSKMNPTTLAQSAIKWRIQEFIFGSASHVINHYIIYALLIVSRSFGGYFIISVLLIGS
ncbi:uncharacterized protein LOC121789311 isoform X1 [Salvia splendens]|uniref:uncharacterized protein LOC121789311 isoform X1 n=1 Tax=Salvia splendens TaxID=180675 RepID=UPI001C2730DD|nr:uncharacterized protein LOC121789311 isoform X1 [Salvia splendens]